MDYKGATSPLEQWAGLAVRDAKARYRDCLKEEERQYFEAGGVKKAGARIRMLERVASTVSLRLSEDFLTEADAVGADALSIQQAQSKVLGFFDHILREARAMASFMHPGKSFLNKTNLLIENLRSDFADRTESFLSRRKMGTLREISNLSVKHRYDEVLLSVQARHVEIEEQFQKAGRGFHNAGFVTAQVGTANDCVMDFLRDELAKATVEPTRLKEIALQLHSEALARIYMGLRHDDVSGLILLSSECTDVFASKRHEGVQRIIRETLMHSTVNTATAENPTPPPARRGYDDTALVELIYADRLAGKFPNDWQVCLHYEEQAEGSKTPETRARRLQEKLKIYRKTLRLQSSSKF